MARRRKKSTDDFKEDTYEEQEEFPSISKRPVKDSEEIIADIVGERQLAIFAGMDSVEDALYEDVEYDDESEMNHPAEIAARYKGEEENRSQIGGSDDQILNDLQTLWNKLAPAATAQASRQAWCTILTAVFSHPALVSY